jgi:hypothetical protein
MLDLSRALNGHLKLSSSANIAVDSYSDNNYRLYETVIYDSAVCFSAIAPMAELTGWTTFLAPPATPIVAFATGLGLAACMGLIAIDTLGTQQQSEQMHTMSGIFTPPGLVLGLIGGIADGDRGLITGQTLGGLGWDVYSVGRSLLDVTDGARTFQELYEMWGLERTSIFIESLPDHYLLRSDYLDFEKTVIKSEDDPLSWDIKSSDWNIDPPGSFGSDGREYDGGGYTGPDEFDGGWA